MSEERTIIYHERPQICPRCGRNIVWEFGGNEDSKNGWCHCTLCSWQGEWYQENKFAEMYAELRRRADGMEAAMREAIDWLQQYRERYHLIEEPPIARLLRETLGGEQR